MASLVVWIDRIFRTVLCAACVALLLTMLGSIVAQVIARYVFNLPLVWSEELARYAMIWLAMLAAAVAAREGQHISLGEMVPLAPRARLIVNAVLIALVAATLLALIQTGWTLTGRTMRQTSAVLGVPMGWIYAAIPVGSALMIAGMVLGWLRVFLAEGRKDPAPAAGTVV